MKRLSLTFILVANAFCFHAIGQDTGKHLAIKPISIHVSTNKTSNIIFPYPIIGVDRGSADVLVQKAEGADNILQLKAVRENFDETNITVITKEAGFYSFMANYAENPIILNIQILSDSSQNYYPEQPKVATNYFQLSKLLAKERPFIKRGIVEQGMSLRLNGIYLLQNKMWFIIRVKNMSDIDYQVDHINFTVRERSKPKRTAVQELERAPIYATSKEIIKGREVSVIGFSFEPFNISNSKELIVQVSEKNGERTIKLPVYQRIILRAKKIE
jgi:conjugative transposon TraN protein